MHKLIVIAMWASVVIALTSLFQGNLHLPTAVLFTAPFLLGYLALHLNTKRVAKAAEPDEYGAILGENCYRISEGGVEAHGPNYIAKYEWNYFIELAETETLFIMLVENAAGILVPKRDLEKPAEFRELVVHLSQPGSQGRDLES